MSERIEGKVLLKVNDQEIPMNDFVRDVVAKVVHGLLDALDNIPADRTKVELNIELQRNKEVK